jgi:hypothetical protein
MRIITKLASWAGPAFLVLIATASAGADPSADARLIFDPAALDRSQWGADRVSPSGSAGGPATPAPDVERAWLPDTSQLPDLGDRSLVSKGLSRGLSSTHDQVAPANVSLFEQRLTPGALSIGLETETVIKQRSLAGDGDKDPDRDALLDPRRQRGFIPFIGLSAKSTLQ